jgi:hypothetical protein
MSWYKPFFLAELYEDDRRTICFSDHGDDDKLYPLKFSPVLSSCCAYRDDCVVSEITIYFQKQILKKLVAFVGEDARKRRVDTFKELFKRWVDYLSNAKNKQRFKAILIDLFVFLNWSDTKFVTAGSRDGFLSSRESRLRSITKAITEAITKDSVCL